VIELEFPASGNVRKLLCVVVLCVVTIGLASCGGVSAAPINGASLEPVGIAISPGSSTVNTGETQTFTATVSNTSKTSVTWLVDGIPGGNSAIGTIAKGVYTAPIFVPNPSAVTVTAVSDADSSKAASAAVSITGSKAPGADVSISPTSATVQVGTNFLFSASVTGVADTSVSWLVNGVLGGNSLVGTILPLPGSENDAIYTAPLNVPNPPAVTVTAMSNAQTSATASSTVTIVLPSSGSATVTITPDEASLQAGTSLQFTATVVGTTDTSVTWEVDGLPGGNATLGTVVGGPGNTGTYTAPAKVDEPITVAVTALSNGAPPSSATAIVTVIPANPITVQVIPSSVQIVINQTQQFEAEVSNTQNQTVTWQVNGITGGNSTLGTISTAGLYTAPASVPTTNPVTVTALANADGKTKGNATVTINAQPVVTVTIDPTSADVMAGTSQGFVATVTGTDDPTVTWEVNGEIGGDSTIGTIQSGFPEYDATYTAPVNIPNPPQVTVTAVSVADPTKSASASVTVTSAISVDVNPSSATLLTGQTQQFTATVTGTSDQIVYWSLSGADCTGAACGTIDSTGLYTAPANVPPNDPTVTVTATADADPKAKGTAIVTISENTQLSIAIFPNPPAPIEAGVGTITFNVVITNAPPDTQVNWSLGCISLYDGDAGENCNDLDFDGDGPGCTTLNGIQVCGARPNVGPGNDALIYAPPHKLFTTTFAPNSCELVDNGSGDGFVPLTASVNYNGQNATQTVCITVTP